LAENHHTLISDEVNTGKSSKLWELVKFFINQGRNVSGWISLPYFENDIKTGYDIVFITMSKIQNKRKFIRKESFQGSAQWRSFFFDETVFVDSSKIEFGKPDIFVIDEVGPLELCDHMGFWPVLHNIYNNRSTLTVVRRKCVDQFRKEFSEYEFNLLAEKG